MGELRGEGSSWRELPCRVPRRWKKRLFLPFCLTAIRSRLLNFVEAGNRMSDFTLVAGLTLKILRDRISNGSIATLANSIAARHGLQVNNRRELLMLRIRLRHRAHNLRFTISGPTYRFVRRRASSSTVRNVSPTLMVFTKVPSNGRVLALFPGLGVRACEVIKNATGTIMALLVRV